MEEEEEGEVPCPFSLPCPYLCGDIAELQWTHCPRCLSILTLSSPLHCLACQSLDPHTSPSSTLPLPPPKQRLVWCAETQRLLDLSKEKASFVSSEGHDLIGVRFVFCRSVKSGWRICPDCHSDLYAFSN